MAILHEALARDEVRRETDGQENEREARSEVEAFIQQAHHFRVECLKDIARLPIEHVALLR